MEHAKHIIRAVLLLVVAAVLFVLVRHFAIPETFGEYGHYRYASVEEHRQPPRVHGPPGACEECHDEQPEALAEGKHATVSCEVCHAPLGTHVTDGEKTAEMAVNDTYEMCKWCHEYLVARPKEFPQVVVADHLSEKGEEQSERVCLECHDAHNPGSAE